MYHFEEKIKEGKESIDLLLPILQDAYDQIKFERFDNGDNIDRKFSVDILANFPDRAETWAVKFRDPQSRTFGDITFELLNGNNTKGDFYRFNGGVVTKYIYGWRDKNSLYDIHICNAKKLVAIPKDFWKGNIKKELPGIGTVDCYQNEEYGRAWFTAINLCDLRKNYPNVIEDILNKKVTEYKFSDLDEWL